MIKYIQFTSILIILAAMIACGGEDAQQSSDAGEAAQDHAEQQHSNSSDHDHPTKEDGSLTLNNGEKWTANPETTEGVQNMIAHMKENKGLNEVEQCTNLQSALQEDFNYIISKCTMKGEAHDQLHNFLMVIQNNLEGLGSGDLEQCKKSYKEISAQLVVYDEYFK